MIQYPYAIKNSYCCNKPDFQTICAYCICPGYKTVLQIDCTGHNNLPIHLQSQTYKDENGNLHCVCHLHHCYWPSSPTIEQFNSAVKLTEYAILKTQK